jgi:hypothetical protein
VLSPSRKSQHPDTTTPINLAFRLRQILGVGIRAEVIRVLLSTEAPWVNAQALARSTGYSKRNVHNALAGLNAAGVVSAFTVAAEQRYTADRSAWAALLGTRPDELPAHRDWPQLLTVLRQVLRWAEQPELATMSDYLRSSRANDLLEIMSSDLAFVGIPTHSGRSTHDTWSDLKEVIECVLAVIGAGTVANAAIAGAGSKPVPATAGTPADAGRSIPSAVAYRIEEGWDLAARRAIPAA